MTSQAATLLHVGATKINGCPYVCESSDHPGFMVELITRALEPYGVITRHSVVKMSELNQPDYDAIISEQTADLERNYHFLSTPLAKSRMCVYRNSRQDWYYSDISVLYDKAGALLNSARSRQNVNLAEFASELEQAGTAPLVSLTPEDLRLSPLLKDTGADFLIADQASVSNLFKNQSQADHLINVGCLPATSREIRIGLLKSAANTEVFIAALESQLPLMDSRGELDRLMTEYGLKKAIFLEKIPAAGTRY